MAGLRGIASWIGILVLLLVSTEIAFAELPPSIDLNVSKIASYDTNINVSEVPAGTDFYYNISVTNNGDYNATDVVVTDKLPYDVIYDSTEVYGAHAQTILTDDVDIHKTGDLLYVSFGDVNITKHETFYINISVKAPSEAPTTLYNIVNLRYANDPDPDNNTFTLATYVPVEGYDKVAAVESFEELLHNQTRLLFDFEDLLHATPLSDQENYTFIASFEQLLRAQANLSLSFEDLLKNETNDGWDMGNFSKEDRTFFLKSFKRIIWDDAFLFASFEMKLKDAWLSLGQYGTKSGHSQDAQTEFIASFEDLLKEQVKLFDSYQLLLKTIGDIPPDDKVDAFTAFESLLRVEANLLMSFEDVLKMKYLDPVDESIGSKLRLTVRSKWLDFSQLTREYKITVSNIGSTTASLINLTSIYEFAYDNTTGDLELLLAKGQSPGWIDDIEGQLAHYQDPLPSLNPGESIVFKMTLHIFPLELGELRNRIYLVSDVESLTTRSFVRKTIARAPPILGNETNETSVEPS